MSESRAQGESRTNRPSQPRTDAPEKRPAADEGGGSVDRDADDFQDLEEVLGVASSALRKNLRGPEVDIAEFEEIEEMFEGAVRALSSLDAEEADPRETHELDEASEEERALLSGGISAQDLTKRLALLDAGDDRDLASGGLDFGNENRDPELVSILLSMLPIASNAQVTGKVLERIHSLSPERKLATVETIRSGLADLAETLPFETFDHVYPVLARILALDARRPMVEEMPRLASGASERAREALWPWVVDELLREPRTQEQLLGKGILDFVDELPPHAIARGVERLCRLPALATGRLAQNFFDVRQQLCYRTFAHLLRSPRAEAVGPTIFAVMRTHPVRLKCAHYALQAVEQYRPEFAEFLHHLLLGLVAGEASPDLVEQSCALLNRGLRRMDAARRTEDWVAPGIRLLGEARFAGARSTLQMIRGQRKMYLLNAWPGDCRKEAAYALDRLSTSGAHHG